MGHKTYILLTLLITVPAIYAKAQYYIGANMDIAIPNIKTEMLNDNNRMLFSGGGSIEGRYILDNMYNIYVQAGFEDYGLKIHSKYANSQDYRTIDYRLDWDVASAAMGLGLSLGDEVIGGDFSIGLAGIYPIRFRQTGTYTRESELEGTDTVISYQNDNMISNFKADINIFLSFNMRLRLINHFYGNIGLAYRSGHAVPYEADLYNDSYERQHINYLFIRLGLLYRINT